MAEQISLGNYNCLHAWPNGHVKSWYTVFPSSTSNINEGKKSTNIFDMPIGFHVSEDFCRHFFLVFQSSQKMFYGRFIGGAGLIVRP